MSACIPTYMLASSLIGGGMNWWESVLTIFLGNVIVVIADPSGYVFTWLIGYSALLGPIGGVMIADYFVIRGKQLNAPALYSTTGEYTYTRGFSWVAIVALLAGALPSLPGLLVTIKAIDRSHVAPFLLQLYNYAWFVGFGIAFAVYWVLRKIAPRL